MVSQVVICPNVKPLDYASFISIYSSKDLIVPTDKLVPFLLVGTQKVATM